MPTRNMGRTMCYNCARITAIIDNVLYVMSISSVNTYNIPVTLSHGIHKTFINTMSYDYSLHTHAFALHSSTSQINSFPFLHVLSEMYTLTSFFFC